MDPEPDVAPAPVPARHSVAPSFTRQEADAYTRAQIQQTLHQAAQTLVAQRDKLKSLMRIVLPLVFALGVFLGASYPSFADPVVAAHSGNIPFLTLHLYRDPTLLHSV